MANDGRHHWSNAGESARFFVLDAVVSVPWLLCLLFPRIWTLCAALFVSCLCIYVEMFKGMSLLAFARSLVIGLTGRVKSTVNIIDDLIRG